MADLMTPEGEAESPEPPPETDDLYVRPIFWTAKRPSSAVDLSGKLVERQPCEQHRAAAIC